MRILDDHDVVTSHGESLPEDDPERARGRAVPVLEAPPVVRRPGHRDVLAIPFDPANRGIIPRRPGEDASRQGRRGLARGLPIRA